MARKTPEEEFAEFEQRIAKYPWHLRVVLRHCGSNPLEFNKRLHTRRIQKYVAHYSVRIVREVAKHAGRR